MDKRDRTFWRVVIFLSLSLITVNFRLTILRKQIERTLGRPLILRAK